MDAIIRKLTIHTLRAQLALCEIVSRSLVYEFSLQDLPVARKAEIVERWSTTSMKRTELRLLLEAMQREQGS